MDFEAKAREHRDHIRLHLQHAGWDWVSGYLEIALREAYKAGAKRESAIMLELEKLGQEIDAG